jgi:hypothetical protein
VVVVSADLHSSCYGRLADAASEELLRGQETCLNSDISASLDFSRLNTVFVVIRSIIYICSECVLFSLSETQSPSLLAQNLVWIESIGYVYLQVLTNNKLTKTL